MEKSASSQPQLIFSGVGPLSLSINMHESCWAMVLNGLDPCVCESVCFCTWIYWNRLGSDYVLDSHVKYGVFCVCECVWGATSSSVGVICSRREAEMSWLAACGSRAAAVSGWPALNLAWLMRVESRAHVVQRQAAGWNVCSYTTKWG